MKKKLRQFGFLNVTLFHAIWTPDFMGFAGRNQISDANGQKKMVAR